MNGINRGSLELCNVAETEERAEGLRLQRVPEAVRVCLNSDAQEKARDVPTKKPIVILNLFLRHHDLPATRVGNGVDEYRQKMRQFVRELGAPNVTLLERLLPEETGLTADLLHPGDDGFEWIAHGIIAHLRDQLGFRSVLRNYQDL